MAIGAIASACLFAVCDNFQGEKNPTAVIAESDEYQNDNSKNEYITNNQKQVKSEENDDQKTRDSLKPYVDFLGEETENGDLSVPDEFLENIESVYIMGRIGSVNHAMSEKSKTQIRIMEWIDNENATQEEFENFVSLLNNYWNEEGIVKNYDNMSDETYVWKDFEHSSYVTCWLENNSIKMNWHYDESLGHSKEVDDLKQKINQMNRPLNGKEKNTIDNDILQKVLEDMQKEPPRIGMSAEEVRQSTWGEPDDINKTTYSWGTKEQWCYADYKYIYFKNGIVTAISE